MKISILLPYKENYTVDGAQAAAIWVADFYKYSTFKKTNSIYGNTIKKNYISFNQDLQKDENSRNSKVEPMLINFKKLISKF